MRMRVAVFGMMGLAALLSAFAVWPVQSNNSGASMATTWYVAPGGNNSNNCQTSATACATIAVAIGKAADGATLLDNEAFGEITDDDVARLSLASGPTVDEGDSGFTAAVFSVTLSNLAAFTITTDYETRDGYGRTGARAGTSSRRQAPSPSRPDRPQRTSPCR